MKKFAKLCSLMLALALLVALSAPAFAEGRVTYSGSTRQFIFSPGSSLSPTDLFSFKDVMPGDTLTERIVVKNDTFYGVKINVYMRSLGAQLGTEDFLSQLELSVNAVNGAEMFKAPADQTAQLTNWTLIGTIYSGGEVALDLNLKVPITLGNDYQNQVGYIDWEFLVEELPISPYDPTIPKTGDSTPIVMLAVVLMASAAALVWMVSSKRKANQQ